MKLSLPKGCRRLRIGEIKRKGDRYKRCDGHWIKTAETGIKVRFGYPCIHGQEKYAGIYIRRIK